MSTQHPGATLLDPSLPCALCGTNGPRLLSHIVPSFVFRHASQRSPSGYMRTTFAPNKRVQDGPKDYILCSTCEQRFSRWERTFSQTFKAFYANPSLPIYYSQADALCVLSIVWRVLYHSRAHPELNHLEFGEDYSRTDQAYDCWKDCLLNERHPKIYRLYWIFFDYITNGTGAPYGLNRYIFHATDFDLLASARTSFAYAHIPGMIMFGMTEPHNQAEWRDLRISFNGGRYIHQNRTIPDAVHHILETKIGKRNEAFSQISARQNEIMGKAALKDPMALLKSPISHAVFADMKLSGELPD